jgi:hypothetical protein
MAVLPSLAALSERLAEAEQAMEQALNTHGSGKSDPIQENGDSHEG